MSGYDWSLTPSANQTADAAINWREGMSPSGVNDSARGMMAGIAAMRNDMGGFATLGGTGNAFTLSLSQAMTAYIPAIIGFVATRSNSGALTMSIDGLPAKPLRRQSTVDVTANFITVGAFYFITYNSAASEFLIIGSSAQDTAPVGSIVETASSTLTAGYLWCNGQAVSRTTYAALFAAIGVAYGAGDLSTTFNVPDKRGRVAAGADNMGGAAAGRLTGYTLATVGGTETVTLTLPNIPAHTHTINDAGHTHGIVDPGHIHYSASGNFLSASAASGSSGWSGGAFYASVGASPITASSVTGITVQGNFTGITINNTGSGTAHANVQPTIAMNFMIKY